jgi:peptide/nickel transport system substrate-binding protein
MNTISIATAAALHLIALLLSANLGEAASAASGTLTVVVTDEPKSLDPCDTDLSGNSRVLRNNITETLVNLSPDNGSVTPSLATSWRQLDDLTWEFKLREGVTFHDGRPFDARAVVAALKRAQDPALACEVGLATLKGVKFNAEAVNPMTSSCARTSSSRSCPTRWRRWTSAPRQPRWTERPALQPVQDPTNWGLGRLVNR